MKTRLTILLTGLLALFTACTGTAEPVSQEPTKCGVTTDLYANQYGDEIELIKINDTLMRTIFRNSRGDEFDTALIIQYDYMLPENDSLPLYKLHWGGVKQYENRLYIYEFSSLDYLAQFILLQNDGPFYRINKPVTVSEVITRHKGDQLVDGIYLGQEINADNDYVHLTGTITKEKYPREYYSTPDGPQGMFSDTAVDHYRLVIRDFETEVVPKETFTGTAKTLDHRRAFISDFAGSEAYYLDDEHPWETWPEHLEGKDMQIKAVLVQFEDGLSVLKAWEILN